MPYGVAAARPDSRSAMSAACRRPRGGQGSVDETVLGILMLAMPHEVEVVRHGSSIRREDLVPVGTSPAYVTGTTPPGCPSGRRSLRGARDLCQVRAAQTDADALHELFDVLGSEGVDDRAR